MTIDEHNACPACPLIVRDLYAVGRRVLNHLAESMSGKDLTSAGPSQRLVEYEELYLALEQLRPFVEAHHANQLHACSKELAAVRDPALAEVVTVCADDTS